MDYDFIIHPLKSQYANLLDIDDGRYNWIIEDMENNETGIVEYEWIDNDSKMLVFSRLGNGWILGIAVTRDEIYEPLNTHAQILVLVSLTMMALLSFIGYRFSKRMVNPLEKIVQQVKIIANSKLVAPITHSIEGIFVFLEIFTLKQVRNREDTFCVIYRIM